MKLIAELCTKPEDNLLDNADALRNLPDGTELSVPEKNCNILTDHITRVLCDGAVIKHDSIGGVSVDELCDMYIDVLGDADEDEVVLKLFLIEERDYNPDDVVDDNHGYEVYDGDAEDWVRDHVDDELNYVSALDTDLIDYIDFDYSRMTEDLKGDKIFEYTLMGKDYTIVKE